MVIIIALIFFTFVLAVAIALITTPILLSQEKKWLAQIEEIAQQTDDNKQRKLKAIEISKKISTRHNRKIAEQYINSI